NSCRNPVTWPCSKPTMATRTGEDCATSGSEVNKPTLRSRKNREGDNIHTCYPLRRPGGSRCNPALGGVSLSIRSFLEDSSNQAISQENHHTCRPPITS